MAECDCRFVVTEDNDRERWEEHFSNCMTRLVSRMDSGEFPMGLPRRPDGVLVRQNPHLDNLSKTDYLYHLDMGLSTHDFRRMFGDVKFVCMGGTAWRMRKFAEYARTVLDLDQDQDLVDITASSHRYSMYKVGPVLAVNHGIGCSTLSVVLSEMIKLMQYSEAKNPIFFRLGTSGGLGVKPGTVVISEKGFDGMLNNAYDIAVLGKMVSMPAVLDKRLAQELKSSVKESDGFETIIANTMCAHDFYIGQGRTDGPFCDYTEEDKFQFLKRLISKGIKNIEMEVTLFSAFTYKAGIKAADICVTIVDRLKGDQVNFTKEEKAIFESRPMIVAMRYISQYLRSTKTLSNGVC